jgi:hypothetical protein
MAGGLRTVSLTDQRKFMFTTLHAISGILGRPMATALIQQADLLPFSNQAGRCPRAGRGPIRVRFDRKSAGGPFTISTTWTSIRRLAT